MQITIITGYSGSGKSTALDAFEDAGFYCVDNMPVALLPKFLELPLESESTISGLAFVMDMRDRRFLKEYRTVFENLRSRGYRFEVLFLEAEEQVLVKRFSQTRRQHPLAKGKNLIEGIRDEKAKLIDLRIAADHVIDTSLFTLHQLKSVILEYAGKHRHKKPSVMRIQVLSFGFKHGIPLETDLAVDVRFLSNPYFVEELQPLDGEDDRVRKFVIEQNEARIFLGKFLDMIDYLIPLYRKEGKAYLTIAVGCTGGRHRSVAMARAIYNHIQASGNDAELTHRDIGRSDP